MAFPLVPSFSERCSPSRVRCAAPKGAPWTAPGRSEQPFLLRGKARQQKPAVAYRLPMVGDDAAAKEKIG